jgi:hypothetical protein
MTGEYYAVPMSFMYERLALRRWCRENFGQQKKEKVRRGECQYRWLAQDVVDDASGEMRTIWYFDDYQNAVLFALKWK